MAGLLPGRPRLIAIWNALSPTLRTMVDYPGEATTVTQYRAHLEVKYLSWEALELSKGNVKTASSEKTKSGYKGYGQRSSSGWTPTYNKTIQPASTQVVTTTRVNSTAATDGAVTRSNYRGKFPNTDGRPPPGPCKCGGLHWMKDCPLLTIAKRVYHGAVAQADDPEGKLNAVVQQEPEEDKDDPFYPFAEDEEVGSFHRSATPALAERPMLEAILSTNTGTSVISQPPATAAESIKKYVNIRARPNVFHAEVEKSVRSCPDCDFLATSKRKVKAHLKDAHQKRPQQGKGIMTDSRDATVVNSSAPAVLGSGYEFRKYNYAEVRVRTAIMGPDSLVCADSGCGMSLVDREWAIANFGSNCFATRPTSVNVRGLGDSLHKSQHYVVASIYVPCHEEILAKITRELHVVDGLGCNALLGTDILVPEMVILDLGRKTMTFGSCNNAIADVVIRSCDGRQIECKSVRCAHTVRIAAHTEGVIPIKFRTFVNRDVEFVPEYTEQNCYLAAAGSLLQSVCDATTKSIVFRNRSDEDVIVKEGVKLGLLRDFHPTTKVFHVLPSDDSYSELYSMANDSVWNPRMLAEITPIPIRTAAYEMLHGALRKTADHASVAPTVDINATGTIMKTQSQELKGLIEEFPSLWDDSNVLIDEP